jgi:hypothetical protein
MILTIPIASSSLRLVLGSLFALILTACAGSSGFDLAALQNSEINNFRAPSGATLQERKFPSMKEKWSSLSV